MTPEELAAMEREEEERRREAEAKIRTAGRSPRPRQLRRRRQPVQLWGKGLRPRRLDRSRRRGRRDSIMLPPALSGVAGDGCRGTPSAIPRACPGGRPGNGWRSWRWTTTGVGVREYVRKMLSLSGAEAGVRFGTQERPKLCTTRSVPRGFGLLHHHTPPQSGNTRRGTILSSVFVAGKRKSEPVFDTKKGKRPRWIMRPCST